MGRVFEPSLFLGLLSGMGGEELANEEVDPLVVQIGSQSAVKSEGG